MHWDVVEVRAEPNWKLSVRFRDGLTGSVRFTPPYFTGVFECLRNPEMFARVYVDNGAVAWPGEIDLAPDAMYEEIRLHKEWVLSGQPENAVA